MSIRLSVYDCLCEYWNYCLAVNIIFEYKNCMDIEWLGLFGYGPVCILRQSTLKLRDEEITKAHALVDEFQVFFRETLICFLLLLACCLTKGCYWTSRGGLCWRMLTYADVCWVVAQVRLKVAIEFHEADSRDLHKQIDALSTSTTGNTPWETSSETSSVTSGFSSREHHMDIEVRVTPPHFHSFPSLYFVSCLPPPFFTSLAFCLVPSLSEITKLNPLSLPKLELVVSLSQIKPLSFLSAPAFSLWTN